MMDNMLYAAYQLTLDRLSDYQIASLYNALAAGDDWDITQGAHWPDSESIFTEPGNKIHSSALPFVMAYCENRIDRLWCKLTGPGSHSPHVDQSQPIMLNCTCVSFWNTAGSI